MRIRGNSHRFGKFAPEKEVVRAERRRLYGVSSVLCVVDNDPVMKVVICYLVWSGGVWCHCSFSEIFYQASFDFCLLISLNKNID